MHFLLLALLLLGVVVGPGLWVQRVLQRYSQPEARYRVTGAELARELLDAHGLRQVRVEATASGDHYDPGEKAVRLARERFDGRSLSAITVAAHEVGHAIQDRDGYAPLRARTRLIGAIRPLQRLGAGLLMASPFVGMVTRVPGMGLLTLAGGLLSLGSSTLVHLITLPTEFDASFARALPMLERSGYLYAVDPPHARRILRAAALTYVAAALMSLVNIAQWWAILRR